MLNRLSQIHDHQSPPPHQQEPSDGIPTGPRPHNNDMVLLGLNSSIDKLKKTAHPIDALRGATLEQSDMRQEDIDRLRAAEPGPRLDVTDKHFVMALRIFLATSNTSHWQATYDAVRSAVIKCYPDDPFLSFHQMKQHVAEQLRVSGVVPMDL